MAPPPRGAPKGPHFWKCTYYGSLAPNQPPGREKNRIDQFSACKFNFENFADGTKICMEKYRVFTKMPLKWPNHFHFL